MEPASTRQSSLIAHRSETLLIHLGGLGDVCLSESTFLSLRRHLDKGPVAVGYPRFLNLFQAYFSRVANVDGREWLHLFSGSVKEGQWKQVIFIGKDRDRALRERLQVLSVDPLLFVDMYPDRRPLHVEEHQLAQIGRLGIDAVRKEPDEANKDRIVIYPEKAREKRKWPVEDFLELYDRLLDQMAEVVLLEPIDMDLPLRDKVRIEDLSLLSAFLGEGGLFVSNDCGVAHLAAARGMTTVTLFHDHDPRVWHPRGRTLPLVCTGDYPSVEELYSVVSNLREGFALGRPRKQ